MFEINENLSVLNLLRMEGVEEPPILRVLLFGVTGGGSNAAVVENK